MPEHPHDTPTFDNKKLPWWGLNTRKPVLGDKSVRKYDPRVILVGVVLTVAIVGTLLWSLVGVNLSRPMKSSYYIEYPSSIDSVLTGCGSHFAFTPSKDQYGVFDSPEVIDLLDETFIVDVPVHKMIVPAYGYMSGGDRDLTKQKVYSAKDAPPRSEVLRAMYDGMQVIWFDGRISASERERLVDFIESGNPEYDDVIAIEWTDERPLPLGRAYGFSAWNVTQSCANFAPEIFDEFRTFVETHPEYTPVSPIPPNAKVGSNGKLVPIDDPTS